MLFKILPLLFLFLGTGAGIGAGILLAPADVLHEEAKLSPKSSEPHESTDAATEFVKLNNQFVIPIVQNNRVASLIVLSLSIEINSPISELVFEREPKLRDSFLRVLFDHANMGGFSGSFTKSEMLGVLRGSLKDVAQNELGDAVENVLITDIGRQDN